jgi:hypothetical protein
VYELCRRPEARKSKERRPATPQSSSKQLNNHGVSSTTAPRMTLTGRRRAKTVGFGASILSYRRRAASPTSAILHEMIEELVA